MLFKVVERLSSENLSVHAFAVLFAEFQMGSWAYSGQRFERMIVSSSTALIIP